ncbi:DUF2252 domain-containing protein [Haliangium ochraceum]|uniref:DUF2252 domain-containing protein n=1 Tax=Haliangium ochraceum (strain DSM 14365 / JCM 11303 / SMP-2) TaxID=502025 RepID=D0LTZ4_HALO1|nr:DUF2252 family protein [Haliangium ochraceum]ACY17358.1 Protein of unknown function DUF2252 [Haliangium ochraceum DSM 14365]
MRQPARVPLLLVLATWASAGCTAQTPQPRASDDPDRAGKSASGSVIDRIEARDAALDSSDRTNKHCAMAESPFAFFRGTAFLFWGDLAGAPRREQFGDADTRIWLQGDLHAQNYGAFTDDDGVVIYDLDDFDEAVIGDYQWDVWRMATSIALVGLSQGDFSDGQIDDFLDAFSEHYLDTMADYRGNGDEKDRIFTKSNTYGLLDNFLGDVEDDNSRARMLDKWTSTASGARVFRSDMGDLEPVPDALFDALLQAWPAYVSTTARSVREQPGYFDIKDIARRRNAGLGSLGVPRYYALIEGASSDDDDDRILDVKQQGQAAGYVHLSPGARALTDAASVAASTPAAAAPAVRVVTAYRALAKGADDHLGWLLLGSEAYSVRERSPYKETFPIELLVSVDRLEKLAEQWGDILATAHARADRDFRDDLIAVSIDTEIDERTDGHHSEFRALVREVAWAQAAQVQADHASFAAHVADTLVCPQTAAIR